MTNAPAFQTLASHRAQFTLSNIEPTAVFRRVDEINAFDVNSGHGGNKNIFGIIDPDQCSSKIMRYHSGHSRLLLKIDQNTTDERITYVIFSDVLYFEGPIICTGGSFWFAKDDKTLEILSVFPT